MNKLILCARSDGFGERMLAFLNAMYISEQTKLDFGYIWPDWSHTQKNDLNRMILMPHANMCDEQQIFTSRFIKKYSYTKEIGVFIPTDGLGLFLRHGRYYLNDLKNQKAPYEWGYISTQYDLSKICEDVDSDAYYSRIRKIWEQEIDFTDNIRKVFDCVEQCRFYSENFKAFHLRTGDIIYKERSHFGFEGRKKALGFHLSLGVIKQEVENGYVVIFSDDIGSLNILKDFFKTYKNGQFYNHFILANDLIKQYRLEGIKRTFFEVLLMSRANIIYASGKSGFSNLASMISGKDKIISLYNALDSQKQVDIIEQSLRDIELNPFHEAFSYMHLYLLAKELKQSIDKQLFYLFKAMKCDGDNFTFKILYLDLLLSYGKIAESEQYLKNEFNTHKEEFIKYILNISPYDYFFIYSFVICKLLK
ncbi:hypothetical protein ACLQW7_001726, partial [Campylobacter jejuni]